MYQDEKMILKNNVAPLYVLDKSKGVVTFKWDVRSADGCRMAVGYSKK